MHQWWDLTAPLHPCCIFHPASSQHLFAACSSLQWPWPTGKSTALHPIDAFHQLGGRGIYPNRAPPLHRDWLTNGICQELTWSNNYDLSLRGSMGLSVPHCPSGSVWKPTASLQSWSPPEAISGTEMEPAEIDGMISTRGTVVRPVSHGRLGFTLCSFPLCTTTACVAVAHPLYHSSFYFHPSFECR